MSVLEDLVSHPSQTPEGSWTRTQKESSSDTSSMCTISVLLSLEQSMANQIMVRKCRRSRSWVSAIPKNSKLYTYFNPPSLIYSPMMEKGCTGEMNQHSPGSPKSKDWKAKCDRISSSISTVCSSLNSQIDMLISANSDVNRLLKLAISLSSSLLQKFITWLTKSYEESIEAGFKDDKACFPYHL